MTRIRFTQEAIYETEGPGQGPRFAVGQVKDLREDLAQRWISRGKAELYTPEMEKAERLAVATKTREEKEAAEVTAKPDWEAAGKASAGAKAEKA